MTRYRRLLIASFIALIAVVPAVSRTVGAAGNNLPTHLSDQDFWRLSEELSEPNGYFRSDNLTSNELLFQRVIPALVQRTRPGGVYLGVGPEQNFTYIASLKPKMVFITDIRRGNLHLHLMYKALFEMASDRADFVGMLFSKKRPAGLTAQSTVDRYQPLLATHAVRNHIRNDKLQNLISEITLGKRQGMISLEDSLARLVKQGAITVEDARIRSSRPDELDSLLRS